MYEIVNVQYTGTYNNGGTSIPAVLGEFRASSAADLPAQNVDCHIICGCDGLDIATGDRYIWNGTTWILQPSDRAFSNVYTKPEIDTMINAIYQTMMYYHTAQESTDDTITFYTLGTPVGSLTIYGNGQQTGTPLPAAPITPDFCGTLDNTDWTVPISCGGETTPVYLGQTQTVRRIKKLVLTGNESYAYQSQYSRYVFTVQGAFAEDTRKTQCFCSHYQSVHNGEPITDVPNNSIYINQQAAGTQFCIKDESITSADDFKAFLASEYSAGHPVTIWYVLATPETAIVNEPLAKIGDYADELHLTNADVDIPTVAGENTLTVDTALPPSKIVISGGE